MKLERLSGRKINDTVLRRGKVWRGKTMAIHWLPGAPRRPGVDPATSAIYVGTFASAKLSKSAVVRNRMRRRVREALRVTVKDWKDLPPMQLLIGPRFASLDAPFPAIEQEVRAFLSTFQ